MAFAPAAVVDGPVRQPLPYGLFSVVSLAEVSEDRWENGVVWQALACADPTNVVVGDCDAPEGFPKVFPDAPWAEGEADAFTVYAPYKCNPIGGGSLQTAQDNAREILRLREEAQVESRIWTSITTGATALAGGSPKEALAQAEQWIAENYGSLGVIHMSRYVAVFFKGLIEAKGNQMQTILGTPVVVGAGYPDESPTLVATPAMFGYRSDIFESTSRPGDLLDRSVNTLFGIAERSYLIGIDPCGTATAALTLTEAP